MIKKRASRQRGQAVVLLLALLVAMVALVFWMVDTHWAVMARLRAQDAGDPAVLAAARWQAAGLNLCGELNLIHAYMLADDVDNVEAAQALFELQQRISLVTPVLALQAAQVTARQNGAQPLEEAQRFLKQCAQWIEFPNFYEGATDDFQTALKAVLKDEIYAFPAMPVFPESTSLLGNQDFYEAVLGDDYCWFWFNAYAFLESYRNHRDFGPVPQIATTVFFDLGTAVRYRTLAELRTDSMNGHPSTVDQMNERMEALGHPVIPPPLPPQHNGQDHPALRESEQLHPWMVYGPSWRPWLEMRRDVLPIRADVRPEYDVLGTGTAVTVMKTDFPWLAGAKPFGEVGGEPPLANGLLLGGFEAVRLVPVDALGVGLRPYDPQWYNHLYNHVRNYSLMGLVDGACRYCNALKKWDNPAYRVTVSTWLAQYGHTCRRPKPGRGDTGGSTYAH